MIDRQKKKESSGYFLIYESTLHAVHLFIELHPSKVHKIVNYIKAATITDVMIKATLRTTFEAPRVVGGRTVDVAAVVVGSVEGRTKKTTES